MLHVLWPEAHRLWEKSRTLPEPSLKAEVSGERLLDDSHLGSSVNAVQSLRAAHPHPEVVDNGKPPEVNQTGILEHLKGTHER